MSAPLSGPRAQRGRAACAETRRVLARGGGRAGSFRLRIVCLDEDGGTGRWRLSAVGENARRASEDSAAVGYIGEPDRAASRFSAPILEAAGIPQLTGMAPGSAMERLLRALRQAGEAEDPRQAVSEALA